MRAKGEGTVGFDKSRSKWFAKVPIGHDANGRTIYRKKQADSKSEAQQTRRAMLNERDAERTSRSRPKTFRQFADHHMDGEARNDVRENTRRGYLYHLEHYVYPFCGDLLLIDITSTQISSFLVGLRTKASASQVNQVRATMGRIFQAALTHGLVTDNPVRRTKKMRPQPGDRALTQEPWSLDECRKALTASQGTSLELFMHLLVLTGCRLGEILGLYWSDLDVDARTLSIQRTLVEQRGIRNEGGTKGSPVFNPPKTARSVRTLQASEALLHAFEHQRQLQEESRSKAGDAWVETGCIFTSSVGTPVWPTNYSARFRKFLAQNGLRHQHPHLLRHAFAQNALELGVPIESVSRALGHASLAVTLDIYAKDQRNLQNKATDEIARFFED